jgi:hypothetical protein
MLKILSLLEKDIYFLYIFVRGKKMRETNNSQHDSSHHKNYIV